MIYYSIIVISFYKGGNIIYNQMIREYQYLCKKIASVEAQLAELPPGTISCKKNGKHYQWIHVLNNQKLYLPKNERPLAEQLALKRYLSKSLQDLNREKKAILSFLKHYPATKNTDILFTKFPELKNLLQSYSFSANPAAQWVSEPYPQNPHHPEHLIHECISGNKVRSKSESIIDSFLFLNKIPYRYECQLILGSTILYPDFTILHPETNKIYYWEHFGRMDDPAYARKTANKLQLYISHQIIPSLQLITTYETPEAPLSSSLVEATIAHYFPNF